MVTVAGSGVNPTHKHINTLNICVACASVFISGFEYPSFPLDLAPYKLETHEWKTSLPNAKGTWCTVRVDVRRDSMDKSVSL